MGVLELVQWSNSAQNGRSPVFAGACSTHQNEIVGFLGELACAERFDLGLGDSGCAIIEGRKVLMMGSKPAGRHWFEMDGKRNSHLILVQCFSFFVGENNGLAF